MSTGRAGTTGKVLHGARAYDVLVWMLTLGREDRFRRRLVELADLGAGDSVLDVGCGTGALALAAEARVGTTGRVCGIDPSPEMVARARRKAARRGAHVRFENAAVEALPFADRTFDVVLSTLMLHHLTDEGRQDGLAEIARVLKPGGRFLAVDIGGRRGRHLSLHRRIGRHHDFDLDTLTPLFDAVGFQVVDQGPIGIRGMIGLSTLRFMLTVARSP